MSSDNTVHAEVRPLAGKHYGTEVVVRHPNGSKFSINVWMAVGTPSDDELAEWYVDRFMWESNVEVDDGWGGKEPIQAIFPCDSHYQSRFEEAVARRIADALDGMGWDEQ